MTSPDILTITVGGVDFTGWMDISVTRGLEHFPSDFFISATEKLNGSPSTVILPPGAACQVKLGDDLVLTGWIDDYIPEIDKNNHTVAITGRSLCEDLHDCSALIQNYNQLNRVSLPSIAQQLAAPFKINVKNLTGSDGPVIPLFVSNFGETPFQIVDRIARWNGVGWLVYDDTDGSLVLNTVGNSKMNSGITEGINLERGSCAYSMADRFSEYDVVWQSVYTLSDGKAAEMGASVFFHGKATDADVKRYRPLGIVSEQTVSDHDGSDLSQSRADFEKNRRFGRSQILRATVDSWRDNTGKLWEINALITLNIPSLKLVNAQWLISEVTFRRDLTNGTTADLTCMPPSAFSIEPTNLTQFPWTLQQAISDSQNPGGGTINPYGGAS
jgi:prophage tail gpP-like protein